MPSIDNIAAYNLRPLTLTWLADKWEGFNTDDYRTPSDKDFVESYMKSGEHVVSPLDGEEKRFDYFHTMDYVRRPKNFGCWGGLDRRPFGKNNPECNSCRVRGECRPESETLWVRGSSSRGENKYRFSQDYIETIQKLNSGRRIPLVRLGRVLFKDKLSSDDKVAKRMIETFRLTDQEIEELFTDIPAFSDTQVLTLESIPSYESSKTKLQGESVQVEEQPGHQMEYPQEFNKELIHSDVQYKILTSIPGEYRDYLPSPREPVIILDEKNEKYPTKMHSEQPRIDGLTNWYKNHPDIAIGDVVTVVIESRDRIRMVPSGAAIPRTGSVTYPQQEKVKETPIEPDQINKIDIGPFLIGGFSATGLHFLPLQVATFYTALQTKGFVILSGISGTGKTKLAQHFAGMLPSPTAQLELEPSDDAISISVKPYMLKYSNFIIPKSAYKLFDPPPPGEKQMVEVHFEGGEENCRFVHFVSDTQDYLRLHLRGTAREWFTNTLIENDILTVTPLSDDEGNLYGFDLLSPQVGTSQAYRKNNDSANLLFTPVRPDWRDSKRLLGYFNPLMGTYEWTPFLKLLLMATQSYEEKDGFCWFFILDEMNLARIEYYFADMLSVLESGRDEDGWTTEPLRISYPDDAEGDLPPHSIKLPPNLYIIGTVNVDETTHAFSPKVLDRAFSIELTEVDFLNYPPASTGSELLLSDDARWELLDNFTLGAEFARINKSKIVEFVEHNSNIRTQLQTLNDLLRPHDLHFGYRVFDEIIAFLDNAKINSTYDDLGGLNAAFDSAVLMKVLPKFHGSRGRLEQPLQAVLAWCVNPESPEQEIVKELLTEARADTVRDILGDLGFRYEETAKRSIRMLWSLYTNGFASFG